jgi:serine phosphatase RsbU (regulator of sigma subunit)
LYRSATESARVGGDFYELFETRPGEIMAVVGDVAGHGVGAATAAASIRDTLRAYAYENPHPARILELTNRALIRSRGLELFATAFVAILRVGTGRLSYCSAGHPPALLSTPDGLLELAEGTQPLGLFPELKGLCASYGPFQQGSLLVACTDGISERANPAGDFYGVDSLRCYVEVNRHLDGPDFMDQLLKEVRQFGANAPFEDDLTLVMALSK